jgi:hypothetical protein
VSTNDYGNRDGWSNQMLLATATNPASNHPIIAIYRQTYTDSDRSLYGPGILEVIICPNPYCTATPPQPNRVWATVGGVSAAAFLVAMGIVVIARLRRSKQRPYEAINKMDTYETAAPAVHSEQ